MNFPCRSTHQFQRRSPLPARITEGIDCFLTESERLRRYSLEYTQIAQYIDILILSLQTKPKPCTVVRCLYWPIKRWTQAFDWRFEGQLSGNSFPQLPGPSWRLQVAQDVRRKGEHACSCCRHYTGYETYFLASSFRLQQSLKKFSRHSAPAALDVVTFRTPSFKT